MLPRTSPEQIPAATPGRRGPSRDKLKETEDRLTAGSLVAAVYAVQPPIAAHASVNAAASVAGKLARAG